MVQHLQDLRLKAICSNQNVLYYANFLQLDYLELLSPSV